MKNYPQVGDYIKVYMNDVHAYGETYGKLMENFFEENIGILSSIQLDLYVVEFKSNIPLLNINKFDFDESEVLAFGKTIEELDVMLNANKYNL